MARYTGNHCPVCEQEFTDNDDIVVCPDCGTPYHRACWQKVGACMHQSEHAAGFEWKPKVGAGAAEAAHAATCPNCGTHNTPGAVRCSHCGCPLPKAGEEAPGAAPQKPQDQGPIYARNPGDVNPGGALRNDRAAPAPTSTPTPQARTASSGGRSAPRTPSRASRPRTGPPLWAAARCTT